MNRSYRIANKFRFTLFITLLLLMCINVFGSLMGYYTVDSATELKYKEVSVDAGDTLWQLVEEYGSNNIDLRKAIYETCQLNHMQNQTIYPGQIIKIPIYN